jgi:hypothetical protein
MTPQGQALYQATVIFGGDDQVIGHPCCKYKFQPLRNGVPQVACWQHEAARRKRRGTEGTRPYEYPPDVFWGGAAVKKEESGGGGGGGGGGKKKVAKKEGGRRKHKH